MHIHLKGTEKRSKIVSSLVNTLRKWDQLWARTYSIFLAALGIELLETVINICLSLLMWYAWVGLDRQNHLYGKSVIFIGQDEV